MKKKQIEDSLGAVYMEIALLNKYITFWGIQWIFGFSEFIWNLFWVFTFPICSSHLISMLITDVKLPVAVTVRRYNLKLLNASAGLFPLFCSFFTPFCQLWPMFCFGYFWSILFHFGRFQRFRLALTIFGLFSPFSVNFGNILI